MSKAGIFTKILLCLFLFAVFSLPAAAQIKPVKNCDNDLGIPCSGNERVGALVTYIIIVVNTFLALAGITAVIFVIWGGAKYMTAAGDEQAAESAKKTILYAAIGLIIIGLAAVIVNFVLYAMR